MKLDKAIRRLETIPETLSCPLTDEEREAFKLGIEALKRIKKGRPNLYPELYQLLPGETED